MMDLKNITAQVNLLITEVAQYIQAESKKLETLEIEKKGLNNFVTKVDKRAEIKIVEGLKKILPRAGFLTEEGTIVQDKRLKWIVDPLDGTTNFLQAIPFYSVSIALMDGEELVVGVVYEVVRQECFSAYKNGGAFLNGKKISVADKENLQDAFLATGFPYEFFEKLPQYMKTLAYFMANSRGIRRLGSAALDLVYVACGRFDGFWEYNLNAWDVAAGALIVKEAGGELTDFKGGNDFVFGKSILASNAKVHKELLSGVEGFVLE